MVNEKDSSVEINLLLLVQGLWHHVWAIVLSTVLCASVALGYAAYFVTPTYQATAKMYVNNISAEMNEGDFISNSELDAAQTLVNTYIAILETPDTLEEVISRAGVPYNYQQMLAMVDTGSVNNTEVFYINVIAPSPEDAELIANTISEVLPERIADIVKGSSVKVVQKAVKPDVRHSPSLSKYAMMGALVGFALCCAIIIIMELLDNVIHDEDYPTETYDIRTLAMIPDLMGQRTDGAYYAYEENSAGEKKRTGKKQKKKNKAYTIKEERSILCDKLQFHAAEAYKMLRTNLMLSADSSAGGKVLGVTSSSRNDGKTTMSINLAYTMAQSEKSVLLIEADLRKPMVARRMMLPPEPGLANLLAGGDSDVIQPSGFCENWKIICAGTLRPNPSELLSSQTMVQLLKDLRQQYDIILIDLPPVNEVADALAISDILDGMLVVVRQNSTTKPALELGLSHLAFAKCEIAGFVVTNTNQGGGKYGHYGTYGRYGKYGKYRKYGTYGYGYGYGGQKNEEKDIKG